MNIKPTRTFELKFKDPKLKDQTYYSIRYEFKPNEYTVPNILSREVKSTTRV